MVLVEDWCRAFRGARGCGKDIYIKLAKVKRADFWQGGEAKFLVFMIIRRYGVDFGIGL
jgi:hypothetical protein